MTNLPELVTVTELADWLGISTESLYVRRSRSPETLPPAIRIGRRLYWRPKAIEQWVEDLEATRNVEERKAAQVVPDAEYVPDLGLMKVLDSMGEMLGVTDHAQATFDEVVLTDAQRVLVGELVAEEMDRAIQAGLDAAYLADLEALADDVGGGDTGN